MALDVAMIMRLVDRFTGPAKKMEQSLERVTQKARKIEQGSRGFDRVAASARRAGAAVNGVYLKAMEKAGRATGRFIKMTAGAALSAAKWGAIGAAGTAAFFGGKFLTGIIDVGMQFEQFEAQLEGTEGSALKAKKALDWVMKFASQTPYEMAEVTDAFVRARGVGIDPFTGALRTAGDAAAANRKSIMQAVEALADAQTGEFERLKEFNITSSVKGDQVSFAFVDKKGLNAVKTVKKDMSSIRNAVLEIWEARHAGGMIRQSKTLTGLWSNIKDSLTVFQYKIGNSGWFNSLKDKAARFLETLNSWQDTGKLDEWAKKISDRLTVMTNKAEAFIFNTDWSYVANQIGIVAGAAWDLVSALAKVIEQSKIIDSDLNRADLWITANASGDPKVRNAAQKKLDATYVSGEPRKKRNERVDKWVKDNFGPVGAPVLKPGVGKKVSSVNQSRIVVDVKSAPGTSATVKPVKMASNTSLFTKLGKSMATSA